MDVNDSLEIGRKLRTARLKQGLSLRELAGRAEVSASLLSQIETAKANPSVRSLHSIADALDLPINYFFPEEEETTGEVAEKSSGERDGEEAEGEGAETIGSQTDAIGDLPIPALLAGMSMTPSEVRSAQTAAQIEDVMPLLEDDDGLLQGPVVRRGHHQTIELEGGVTWSRLTPGPEPNAEYLLVHYNVGASSGRRMSHHTGREFTYVLSGTLRLDLGFEQYVLAPGDSVIFDSTTPHRLANGGDTPMLALTVLLKPKAVDG